MMLSDVDIRNAIKQGDLVFEPFHESAVRPAGVTLHLGETILRPIPGTIVDVRTKTLPDYETIILTDDNPLILEPGGFVLGATFEKVTVGNRYGFLIEGRSTLARVGLTIVQTAMLVYPGHRDRAVTLELANHGVNAIKLYPQMKIARAAIFELKTASAESYDDRGKYAGQTDVGPPIFKSEIREE
jgi:dCTP deaminase